MTSYDWLISDCSSDVCSSDLRRPSPFLLRELSRPETDGLGCAARLERRCPPGAVGFPPAPAPRPGNHHLCSPRRDQPPRLYGQCRPPRCGPLPGFERRPLRSAHLVHPLGFGHYLFPLLVFFTPSFYDRVF